MKRKLILTVVVAIILFAAAIGGYFVGKKDLGNNVSQTNSQNDNAQNPSRDSNAQTERQATQNRIITDDFEINLPEGWQETAPSVGVSAMAADTSKETLDPAARKINFQSYYAVSYDTFEGENISDYLQIAKNELSQTISGVVFSNEAEVLINGQSAAAVEANLNQQGVDFKVLLVAISGKDNDIWVITFNTTQSEWNEYRQTFSEIANSFKLKK